MNTAYICDAIRTPIGSYGGSLSSVRADDLGAIPLKALLERNPNLDPKLIDDVVFGCANQAGEDNRNVARMSLLLAGLPIDVPGTTINRLCGSGLDAVSFGARGIKSGELSVVVAGGVESMSRSPFVMPKADDAFSRTNAVYDTTIGWRFVNNLMNSQYGTDSMPETAENVAEQFEISREDQDLFALNSQQKAKRALDAGIFKSEIVPVVIPQRKSDPITFSVDEHPRPNSTIERLNALRTPFKENGTVTAGNASGVNDGAAALLMASDQAVERCGLIAKAKVVATAVSGVEPRIMGYGPVEAVKKVLSKSQLSLEQIDVIELNEAFASQALAVLRGLDLKDDDCRVNPNGGAIALGHPLGMSGARLITTAINQLHRTNKQYALCAMCIGVGQGIATIIERV